MVIAVRPEEDGDYHVVVRPDPGFGSFLNQNNRTEQHGGLVTEIMPRPVAARSLRRRARKRVRDLLGSLPWHYTLDEIGAWLVAENLGVELRAVGYRND